MLEILSFVLLVACIATLLSFAAGYLFGRAVERRHIDMVLNQLEVMDDN